jgi:hypothetical protein
MASSTDKDVEQMQADEQAAHRQSPAERLRELYPRMTPEMLFSLLSGHLRQFPAGSMQNLEEAAATAMAACDFQGTFVPMESEDATPEPGPSHTAQERMPGTPVHGLFGGTQPATSTQAEQTGEHHSTTDSEEDPHDAWSIYIPSGADNPLLRDKRLRSFLQREMDRRREIRDPLTPPWLRPANRDDPEYWNDALQGNARAMPFWLFALMQFHTEPLMCMVYTLWTNAIVLDYKEAHDQAEEDALQLEQTKRGSQYWAKQMTRLWPDVCDSSDMDNPAQFFAESLVHIARLADTRTAEILEMAPQKGILDPEAPYAFTMEAKLRVVYKYKQLVALQEGVELGFHIPNWGLIPNSTGRATEAVLGADTPYRILDDYPGPFDNGRTNADFARARTIYDTTMSGGRPLRGRQQQAAQGQATGAPSEAAGGGQGR